MNRQIKTALDDISLIKAVIERTQKDFADISMLFIWIGICNLIILFVEQVAYFIRSIAGYGFWLVQVLGQSVHWMRLVGYIFLFTIFYYKIKTMNNDISEGMIKIWGIVLIGSNILSFLYTILIPSGNNDKIITLWKCKELIIILPVIFALFMTGILTKRNVITVSTAIYSIMYFILFLNMKEIYHEFLGRTGISLSGLFMNCLMILGMIILGIYLKIGAKSHGIKCDTRGVSNKA